MPIAGEFAKSLGACYIINKSKNAYYKKIC